MRHPELLIEGTMIHVSWSIFYDIENSKRIKDTTWRKRPIWSPLIVCKTNQTDLQKMKWKKLIIELYDVTQMKYIEWSYQFILDAIEKGQIDIVK